MHFGKDAEEMKGMEKYMNKIVKAGRGIKLAIVAGICAVTALVGFIGMRDISKNDSQEKVAVASVQTAYVLSVEDTEVAVSSFEEATEVVNTVKEEYHISAEEGKVLEASIEPVSKPMVMEAEESGEVSTQVEEQTVLAQGSITVTETKSANIKAVSVEEAVALIKEALQLR